MFRIVIVLLAACSVSAHASFIDDYFTDPDDGAFDTSNYLSTAPLGFLPVPVIITDPATGNGLAVAAMIFHESEEQKKQRISKGALLPENISIVGGGGTSNGSWAGGVGHLGFWKKDTVRYKGYLLYPSFNLDFYSLPGIELPRPVELNIEGPFIDQKLTFKLPDTHWFLGARQVYRHVETTLASVPNLPITPPGFEDFLTNHIGDEVTTSGLGLVAEYDSRNNPFNPETGFNLSLDYMWYEDAFGSDVSYGAYTLISLNYFQFQEKWNLGLRLQYDAVEVDDETRLPAYVPPGVSLRGVGSARYQGLSVATVEAELDYKIDARWKVGVFSGTARAEESFSDLDESEHINTYGAGFRYMIARRYGFSMGIDVARGPEDTAVYIQAGSNW